MASLKDVKTKIGATDKIQQITKAMKMVATSRLRGAQTNMDAFRPYAMKFSEVLGSVAEKTEEADALLIPREEVKRIHIVLCTSDRGLCGGFNTNVIEKAEAILQDKIAEDIEITVTAFGKKGRDWCVKNQLPIVDEHIGVVGTPIGFGVASTAGQKLVGAFLDGMYDEVHVVYPVFENISRQVPSVQQLLPIPPVEVVDVDAGEDRPFLAEHICEPSPQELLGVLLPRSVSVQLYRALLDTSTSEHAARMTAMENATKACHDMIEELKMVYNKARQAAITADLMDIVGGAEALKG
ncbi:MAG: ATP synthase F1 subunit gamma [Desulfobacterales bacterium]